MTAMEDAFDRAGVTRYSVRQPDSRDRKLLTCTAKVSYVRLIDAEDALVDSVERSRDGSHAGMRVYRCVYGPHFHIGHA